MCMQRVVSNNRKPTDYDLCIRFFSGLVSPCFCWHLAMDGIGMA